MCPRGEYKGALETQMASESNRKAKSGPRVTSDFIALLLRDHGSQRHTDLVRLIKDATRVSDTTAETAIKRALGQGVIELENMKYQVIFPMAVTRDEPANA